MGFLGVGLVFAFRSTPSSTNLFFFSKLYMLAIEDASFDAAVEALHRAGFRDAPWSYGSINDPQFYQDKKMQDIHRYTARQYRSLDNNSRRFVFPLGSKDKERVVLLPSSYVHLSLSSMPESRFTRRENIYYPDTELLLESFVKTLVGESTQSTWTSDLRMWAIAYVYGQLMVNDNALDSICDEQAKTWFNDRIRRFSGGIDRTTVTKRVGRKAYHTQL